MQVGKLVEEVALLKERLDHQAVAMARKDELISRKDREIADREAV